MRLPKEFELEEMTLEELNRKISEPNFMGVIRDLPEELYHKCLGLSRSRIVEAEKNISNFIDYATTERKVTPAMQFGTDVHCAVLEPKKFSQLYVAEPAKEDYEGLLQTSDQYKKHLEQYIDIPSLEKDVALAEKISSERIEKQKIEIANQEKSIEALIKATESKEFKTKKELNAEIKKVTDPAKEALKTLKAEHKKINANDKEGIKKLQKKLSEAKSAFKGTNAKLISKIREFDTEVPIWDEIITKFREDSVGKRIISQSDLDRLIKILENAKRRFHVQQLMGCGIPELTLFWTDQETGLLLKIRLDLCSFTEDLIIPSDIKTCQSAEDYDFARDAGNKRYHVQAAMYLEGVNVVFAPIIKNKVEAFVFIACENQKACEVNEVQLGSASIEKGNEIFRSCLQKIKDYQDSLKSNKQIELGYSQEVEIIDLPIYQLA